MEHIVLEYDENTRTALVVATSGGREPVLSGHASPYIVAAGYPFLGRRALLHRYRRGEDRLRAFVPPSIPARGGQAAR